MIGRDHESYGRFYRRPLPLDSCTDMSSADGEKLFASAFGAGHAKAFFPLISQFRTQDEPAFCGVSTLVMVLNALAKDPAKAWKGVWRWWVEDMLDCCISLDEAKTSGITLDEFVCLAVCQGLQIQTLVRPPVQITGESPRSATCRRSINGSQNEPGNDIDAFRRDVVLSCKSNDKFLVVSYDRKILSQTGSGHFSPIGAFDPKSDKVLILDVARFKYPPHWVKLELLWMAMQSLDMATSLPRGWVILTKRPQVPLLVKCAPLRHSCNCVSQMMQSVPQVLNNHNGGSAGNSLGIAERLVHAILDSRCCSVKSMLGLLIVRGPPEMDAGERALDEWRSECLGILSELRSESVYEEVGRIKIIQGTFEAKMDGHEEAGLEEKAMRVKTEKEADEAKVKPHDIFALLILALLPPEVFPVNRKDSPLAREIGLIRAQLHALHEFSEDQGEETKMGSASTVMGKCCGAAE